MPSYQPLPHPDTSIGLHSLGRDFEAELILAGLTERLRLLETVIHAPRLVQRFIATETTNLFVPLAHRYGFRGLKGALEDACLRILDPQAYGQIQMKLKARGGDLNRNLSSMADSISSLLHSKGIKAKVKGRIKSISSIYRKMRKNGIPFEKIQDVFALRIITENVRSCYESLGAIREKWPLLPEKFRDYILTPKMNGYQSIHAKIKFGPHILEIQLRTREMDREAEGGQASHFYYKEVRDCEDETSSDWKVEVIRKLRFKRAGSIQTRNQAISLRREKILQPSSQHITIFPSGIKPRVSVFRITRRLLRSRSGKNLLPGSDGSSRTPSTLRQIPPL